MGSTMPKSPVSNAWGARGAMPFGQPAKPRRLEGRLMAMLQNVELLAKHHRKDMVHLWNNEPHNEGLAHCKKLIVDNEPIWAHYRNNEPTMSP